MPRVTLVTRKAYGGAYIAMNARSLGATKVFAWPGAEVAVMGPVAAVRILHRRKLAGVADDVRPQLEAELAAEHERIAGGVEKAVEIGVVDEIVTPQATRSALARAIGDADHGDAGSPHQHPAVTVPRTLSQRRLESTGPGPAIVAEIAVTRSLGAHHRPDSC